MGGENFLNHSCDPNAGFKGQIVLVAMRDIQKDEQITIDYAMVLHKAPKGSAYRMQCLCGAATCRLLVTENDWKIKTLQVKYRGWFQPYLQEEIDRQSVVQTDRRLNHMGPSIAPWKRPQSA
jgi:hypothetical protein